MPKRSRSGAIIPKTNVKFNKTYKRFRKRGRRVAMRRNKRGSLVPKYLFHRWITSLPAANVQTSSCFYNNTTSVITFNTSSTEASLCLYFSLGDIPNVSEFSSLFDQYKLNGVMLQLKLLNVPENNSYPNTNYANYGNFYPTIWYAPDHDDNGTITLAQIKEFERVRHKVAKPNREMSIMLKPTPLIQMYNTALTANYGVPMRSRYLDMAKTETPHYGIKIVFDFEGLNLGATVGQSFSYKLNAKYYFSCMGTR